jgi:hypothetical protein
VIFRAAKGAPADEIVTVAFRGVEARSVTVTVT